MQGIGDSKAPNTRARDERIKAHLDLVESIARNIRGRPLGRGIELDDLVAYGRIGLVEAATRFEERGEPFSTFARPRIYGAIVDGIRTQHWFGRRADRRLRIERVGHDWQVAVGNAHRAQNDVRRNGRPMVCPPTETEDVTEQVAAALRDLPVLERRLVELHHYQDKTITQAAKELRIGRPRASRLHARALVTLRAAVENATSHRSMLAEARMLAKWCVAKRWLRSNPVTDVEGVGKRRHGKAQLRIDEARRWMAKAIEFADAGESGAIAAMMALLLGMRASEIVSRVVRDLDDGGHLLWIPTAKTEAGKRTLRVPDMLRSHLQRLAADQKPDALLFGQHWRDWPPEWVQRICEKAGVPKVTAHGMRGLHSTLAMEAGVTGAVVAASLGHEHVSTTIESYARPEAVAGAQQRRALTVLAGGAR